MSLPEDMENVLLEDNKPIPNVKAETGFKRSFRLRPVDTTGRISKKYGYLKSPCIRSIAWIQLLLGIVPIVAQTVMLCVSRRLYTDDLAGSGIFVGIFQILSSMLTLMAVADPAYFWLHTAMASNFITAVAFYVLGTYICYYPLAYFKDFQQNLSADNPYTKEELDILIKCGYAVFSLSMIGVPIATFLGVCCSLPVCCGQKEKLPFGKRKPSDGQNQSQLKSSTDVLKAVGQQC